MSSHDGTPTNAGLKLADRRQATLDEPVVTSLGPRRSEWVPDVLEATLPTTCRTIREIAGEHNPRVLADNRQRSSFVREVLLEDVLDESGEIDLDSADAGAALDQFFSSLLRYAADFDGFEHDLEEWSQEKRRQRLDDLDTITSVGTGRGSWNAGSPVLDHGVCRILREAGQAPTLKVVLDGEAWLSVGDNRTAQRSLDTLSLLGEVLDLRLVMSAHLQSYLERHFEDWCESVRGLTEPGDTSHVPAPVCDDATDADLLADAWPRLVELAPVDNRESGLIRLLANLDKDRSRQYQDLKQDDEIGLAEGTVDRYVGDLEAKGLVNVDRSDRPYCVTLSSLGDVVVRYCVTDDHRLCHPQQSQFGAPYSDPPSLDKYSVMPGYKMGPQDGGGGVYRVEPPCTADEWLSSTGDPDDGAAWTQWIDGGPSKTIDSWGMHDRLRAGRRADGVNLVDHEIAQFEDGRVSYLSDHEDHVQVVVQWGGSLPTLGRLPAALLSDRAFSKILEPSRIGSAFSNLLEDVVQDVLKEDIDAIIQRGMQVGWFSEDELQFEDFRERWGFVRSELLARLARAQASNDVEFRADLYEDLHGLLASATALYRALGKEITFHVRMPDTAMLKDDEKRYHDFLRFMKETVPKQTAYGYHSGNRMILEHRAEKLQRRLPYDVQDDDPTMDLTANWVVAGPQASLLQEDIEDAIASNHDDVREAIIEGNETAPAMEIPVVATNEFGGIKAEIKRHLERKGFRADRDDVIGLTRACMAVLGTETRGASPFDVCEALLHLKKQPGRDLTVAQLENVLAMLPADRMVRSEKPTVQKMLKALLEADEPMGRSDLIDAAGISENSYDRNWKELRDLEAFGLVDRLDDKRWRARLLPFWSDVGHGDIPDDLEDDPLPTTWEEVLFEVALDKDLDGAAGDLFAWPVDFDDVLSKGGWQRWRPMLVWLNDDLFDWHCENRKTASVGGLSKTAREQPVGGLSKMEIARIGRRPAGADQDQTSLDESGASVRVAD